MRIAVFFFFYNMATGLLVPYLPQYFKSLGLTGVELASIQALGNFALIFVPPIWGLIADRTQKPAWLLKLACGSAAVAFVPMLWTNTVPPPGYLKLFVIMALYSLLLSPVVALADTVAVIEARRLGTEYGRLRLWGSLGYIVTVASFSAWLTRGGKIEHVLPFGMVLICAYLVASMFNNATAELHRIPPSLADAGRLLKKPEFLCFLLAELIHWMALAPFYVFFTIHMKDLHLSSYVGIGIGIGAFTEVMMMWSFQIIRRRVPLLLLLGVCSLISSFRWLCDAYLDNGVYIILVQSLHCFTFAACYVGSIVYMERTVPPQLLATGRAMFSSIVMGLGGVLGSILAGKLYDIGQGKLRFLARVCWSC